MLSFFAPCRAKYEAKRGFSSAPLCSRLCLFVAGTRQHRRASDDGAEQLCGVYRRPRAPGGAGWAAIARGISEPKCVSGIQQTALLDNLVLKVVETRRGNHRGDERVNCCSSQLEILLLKVLVSPGDIDNYLAAAGQSHSR